MDNPFDVVNEDKLGASIANKAADRLPAILSTFLADLKATLRELLDDERTINITIQIGGKK